MTTQNNLEENKRIVRAFIETAFNQHQADRAADYMTSDIKWHGGTLGTVEGRDNFAGLIGAIVSALPDLRNVEQDIIAERDIVSVRAVVEGTHKGDLLPRGGRKNRRGVGCGRPACLRLRGWRVHPSLARAEVVAAQMMCCRRAGGGTTSHLGRSVRQSRLDRFKSPSELRPGNDPEFRENAIQVGAHRAVR